MKVRQWDKITHSTAGEQGHVHALSASPYTLYTLHGTTGEISWLDMDPALGFRPDLTAAAYNQHVLIADSSVSGMLCCVLDNIQV